MTQRAGVTLIELSVASTILFILTGILFASWSAGAEAWLTASRKGDLLVRAQLAFRKVERSLQASSAQSRAFENTPSGCLSFASSFGLNDTAGSAQFVASSTGEVQWQKYVVVYHVLTNHQLMWQELPIPTTNPAYNVPTPLPDVDFGSGPQPLSIYRSSGKKLLDLVDSFTISSVNRTLTISIALSNATGTNHQSFTSVTLLRN
jgi:Tfp pilus assembly protein PilE